MNVDALQAQLYALRAQVDALILAVADAAPVSNECSHPLATRRDCSVMGGPERWICTVCGHEHTEGI